MGSKLLKPLFQALSLAFYQFDMGVVDFGYVLEFVILMLISVSIKVVLKTRVSPRSQTWHSPRRSGFGMSYKSTIA